MNTPYQQYRFSNKDESHTHAHFMRHVLSLAGDLKPGTRVLDVGCGNGFLCGEFLKRGCKVVGTDLSAQGIELARQTYSSGRFELLDAGANVLESLGERPFDIVVSTEVVEHLYAPRDWAKHCFGALRGAGRFICTTPYHGYWKNLAISLLGKWDTHASPLWDGGHIKFWSKRTLERLLAEAGFTNFQFRGAERIPGFWMTMIVSAERPR